MQDVNTDFLWNTYEGKHKEFLFTGVAGFKADISNILYISPFEAYQTMVNDEVIDMQTNTFFTIV